MSTIFSASDVSFMTNTLAQVGSWTERSGTVYMPGTVSYSGTSAEAGDPPSVTFGTRTVSARAQNVSAKLIESSSGRYYLGDKEVSVRGSFTSADLIGVDSGTYKSIDGPWKIYMGSHLLYQAICREIK